MKGACLYLDKVRHKVITPHIYLYSNLHYCYLQQRSISDSSFNTQYVYMYMYIKTFSLVSQIAKVLSV